MSTSPSKRARTEGSTAPSGGLWRLDGYRVLITGSTKGIGLATAKEMLSLGASIMVSARTQTDVDSTVEELNGEFPGKVHGCACDVSKSEGREILIAAVKSHWGALDCLVNNAGCNVRKPIEQQTEEEYHRMVTTNMESTYFLSKLSLDLLKSGTRPCVINVSSAAGVGSSGTGAVYAMTKAAQNQLTKALACEWARHGIRVNSIAPWMTLTPMLEDAIKNNPDQIKDVCEATPLGRPGQPGEIAGCITFCALPAAGYMTGQVISIDGGLSAQAFAGPTTRSSM